MKTHLMHNVTLEELLQRDIGRGLPRPLAPCLRRVATTDVEDAAGGQSLRMLPVALMAFEGLVPDDILAAMRVIVDMLATTFRSHPAVVFSLEYEYEYDPITPGFRLLIADVDVDKPRTCDWHHDAVKFTMKMTAQGPLAVFYRTSDGSGTVSETRVTGADRIAASLVRRIRRTLCASFSQPERIFETVVVTKRRKSKGRLDRLTITRRDADTGAVLGGEMPIERFCPLFGHDLRLSLPAALEISHFGEDGLGGLIRAEASRWMPHVKVGPGVVPLAA